MRFNHMTLVVDDYGESRDWYVEKLGFTLEFEYLDRGFGSLEDHGGFAFLLQRGHVTRPTENTIFHLEVDDVDAHYDRLLRLGVAFNHPPEKTVWGYGPELRDPNGYLIRLFDHRSRNP
jgi:catechol 2,3-dioxygenase-like lactoylglutathione lyase family enzyme